VGLHRCAVIPRLFYTTDPGVYKELSLLWNLLHTPASLQAHISDQHAVY